MNPSDFPASFVRNVRPDDETGCWPWVGTMVKGTPVYEPERGAACSARRWVWQRVNGETTLPFCTYTCDDQTCVHPDHAEPMTGRRMLKLRKRRGEPLHNAAWRARSTAAKRRNSKVGSMEQAREIRRRVVAGESQAAVARSLSIARGTVWLIIEGRTWKEPVAFSVATIARQAGMLS